MRNKYNEPRSGCSMLLGCGSMLLVVLIASFIISMSAISGYINEFSMMSNASESEMAEAVEKVMADMSENFGDLNLNPFMILLNAAQVVALFIVFKLLYRRGLDQMGLAPDNWGKMMGLGCLAGIAAISAYALVASVSGAAAFSGPNVQKLLTFDMLLNFIFYVSVGFYEEIVFRGFFMTALKTTRNKNLIFAAPAIIFGLAHLSNPHASALAVLNIVLIGFVFGYMFIKTGSLWMPIGYHIAWNFFQGGVYGIEVSGLTQDSLMGYAALGPDILTGGAFGAEGGLICTAITLAVLACVHFGVKAPGPAWTMESGLPFSPPARVM